jgi:hypothetical protein
MTSSHIYIMYNACYGGFSLSQAAMDEYKRRCPDAKMSRYEVSRNDQVMAQIVKEMGEAANGKHAKIKLRPIPVEYKDYYTIREYDGDENVVIMQDAYELDAVKSLLKDRALSKADKLARIVAVVNQRGAEW